MTIYLERGQGRIDLKEAVAGANGHVSIGEQARSQNAENMQSKKLYREKHNNLTRANGGFGTKGDKPLPKRRAPVCRTIQMGIMKF